MKAISFSTIIVAIVINFFLILTPVAGVGGWYIDEDTCDGEAVEFFQSQLQRAAFAHANLATAFGSMRNQLPEELQMLVLAVLGSGNYENTADAIAAAIAAANVVFLGGSDPTNSQDNYPYIRGLSSWNTAVSQLATSRYPNGLVPRPYLSSRLLLCR